MRAHILSIFRFLNHFHFYLGDQLNLDSLSVSIGLITDRESPKLLPVREITLTNKLVTCVLSGPCDTKALCSFWLENHPAKHRLETNQIMKRKRAFNHLDIRSEAPKLVRARRALGSRFWCDCLNQQFIELTCKSKKMQGQVHSKNTVWSYIRGANLRQIRSFFEHCSISVEFPLLLILDSQDYGGPYFDFLLGCFE